MGKRKSKGKKPKYTKEFKEFPLELKVPPKDVIKSMGLKHGMKRVDVFDGYVLVETFYSSWRIEIDRENGRMVVFHKNNNGFDGWHRQKRFYYTFGYLFKSLIKHDKYKIQCLDKNVNMKLHNTLKMLEEEREQKKRECKKAQKKKVS